ncbi:uncharacterized protein LOC144473617 [Augochlora pura]
MTYLKDARTVVPRSSANRIRYPEVSTELLKATGHYEDTAHYHKSRHTMHSSNSSSSSSNSSSSSSNKGETVKPVCSRMNPRRHCHLAVESFTSATCSSSLGILAYTASRHDRADDSSENSPVCFPG